MTDGAMSTGVGAGGFVDELAWRGQIHQCTDPTTATSGDGGVIAYAALRRHLADPAGSPRRAYVGFDPSADSLTIGNMVTIMLLAHFLRAGHRPVVVQGGATGLIGDPSGKDAERSLRSEDEVASNVAAQRPIFASVFDAARAHPLPSAAGVDLASISPAIVNNHDWFRGMGFIAMLRDVGKHFSVNQMIQKDSVRARLENREQGISYTEFSYQILQAYDFAHLSRPESEGGLGVTLQGGGSDQWGNITAGTDLIRRWRGGAEGEDAASGPFGLTVPLLLKADGTKFGKTEGGAIWLSAPRPGESGETLTRRTSAYAYHQFWLNAADADVGRFLRTFTFLGREEIEGLLAAHAAAPDRREAQRRLAREATSILHGAGATERAEAAGKALFGGELRSIDPSTLGEVLATLPATHVDRARFGGDGIGLVDLLVETGLAGSRREAREFIASGSVSVNGDRVEPPGTGGPDGIRLGAEDMLVDGVIVLRRGRRSWHVVRSPG